MTENEKEIKTPSIIDATASDDVEIGHHHKNRQSISRSNDVDAALEFLQEEEEETEDIISSNIDEKKLIRKIDWMIVPLMWACYNLQYLDKVLSMYNHLLLTWIGLDMMLM